MRCPRCGHNDTRVIDSRLVQGGNAIRRRRECDACSGRFTTYEYAELSLPTVIKSDGKKESWDREKILRGLHRACQKRPVSAEQQNAIVNDIEQQLSTALLNEVTTREIGERVMAALQQVDGVAWVRFASVYLSFQDIEAFIQAAERHAKEAKQDATPPPTSSDGEAV